MESKVGLEGINEQYIRDSPFSTISVLQKYQYQRLAAPNTIRLIKLLPCNKSQADQSLKCELKVVSLSENPSFVALSYTWGEDKFPEKLICRNQAFNITQNLRNALVRFRLPDSVLTIWVDAVCINQEDDQEKSLQVALMAEIYGQATEVLIWLGDESEGSTAVMEYLKRIGQKFLDRGCEIKEPRDERSQENDAIWVDVTGDANLERTEVVWTRPWFSRRWIIQEMALARKAIVHCGNVSMDWDVLLHAATALGRLRGDGSQVWNKATGELRRINVKPMVNVLKLDNIRKEIWASSRENSNREIFECLDDARAFDCRDAKDRVFALMGIFNRGRSIPFEVDYGNSAAEIYEAFARYCLKHGNTVDMLLWAGESNHALIDGRLNIPSWVPDWRLPFRSELDMLHGSRAGHRLKSMVELDESSQDLLARGMLVDRVHAVLSALDAFADPNEVRKWSFLEPLHVPKWYLQLELLFSKVMRVNYGTGKRNDVIFDYQRDRPKDGTRVFSTRLHDGFSAFRSQMLSKLEASVQQEAQPSQPPITLLTYEDVEYHARTFGLANDRCFFITKKGDIGLGPKGICPDDVICVLAGSSVPFIMRPQSDDFCMIGEGIIPIQREAYVQMPNGDLKPYLMRLQKEKYRLIGECYVHGLMRGGVWDLDGAFFEDFTMV